MSAVTGLRARFAHPLALALDERDAFPERACRDLEEWGMHHYYVPAHLGGRLTSCPEFLGLIRVVAAHDLTVAIAHCKTFLGAVATWVAGTPEQSRWLAGQILAGTPVALGLTERGHGSDLLAGETTARPVPGGYRLDGEKWLINNATRAPLMSVLARTVPDGGPRGFDVLLADRRTMAEGDYRLLPKEYTHGIRGADISGIRFRGAFVPDHHRVGPPGSGLETVLKGLFLTRILCTALSLGAAEHALRIAARREAHTAARRRILADAYADLLGAEVLALLGARAIHLLPGELSLLSAAVKYTVPTWVNEALDALARYLGPDAGDPMFRKVRRDAALVGLFDGSTVVNLAAIANQFAVLAGGRRGARPLPEALADVRSAPPPGWDAQRITLLSPRGLSLLNGLPDRVALLPPGDCALLGRRLAALTAVVRAGLTPPGPRPSAAHFDAAARLACCVAGAAAIEVWLANRRHATGPLWHQGTWLAAVLTRVLTRLGERPSGDPGRDRLLCTVVAERVRAGAPLSLVEDPR
ncbi:acyl-CoA dehydrogenase family protein [Streptantibioticus cattleyicolor]|uniref:Acyl-CoA dehydrogenase n=1 Tax=Streptantibioticus cattleyicolor (strain ATCC 35852 / DSM 46488 / JCM 4925 / NBRC 14057 / NRRL 8057) TaxID=1003195 RepID=F8JJJ9_STREN|nr:acyl-CoA dehydrogenase [Streptantibioticus cattleyicolor]AEW98666.1 acyl-CoA dehydrogenase [Streptantibioticus cattleyicolor NRRL 8057 = DSM 46488]CCB72276.1 Acyl-CoA dehydrogenase [Streptantibioticus cattleyicolor NRRL 8057 = DSM 46488]